MQAEGFAAQCIWSHNPDLEETGENLFVGTGSLDPRQALEKWFLGEFRDRPENQTLKTKLVSSLQILLSVVGGDQSQS